jgi:AraC-like DNA-binding protein
MAGGALLQLRPSLDMRTFDPNRPDFAPYGFTCEKWLPRRMPRANRHNEIELNFLRAGSITYLLGGRRVTFTAGRLGCFWAAIPHQLVSYDGGDAYHVATIPLAWFLQCGLPGDVVQRLLRGEAIAEPDDARAAFDAQLFEQWFTDLDAGGGEHQRTVLLEMEARLVRLAEAFRRRAARPGSPRRLTVDLGPGGISKVEQMATFLAQHYTEHLSVSAVASQVGLHPNYAMSVFRKAFGTTLLEYLTQLRISHAQRLLATTDDKVLDVALSSGFSSISRFNAAFGRVCGCTPTAYRAAHRLERA